MANFILKSSITQKYVLIIFTSLGRWTFTTSSDILYMQTRTPGVCLNNKEEKFTGLRWFQSV